MKALHTKYFNVSVDIKNYRKTEQWQQLKSDLRGQVCLYSEWLVTTGVEEKGDHCVCLLLWPLEEFPDRTRSTCLLDDNSQHKYFIQISFTRVLSYNIGESSIALL